MYAQLTQRPRLLAAFAVPVLLVGVVEAYVHLSPAWWMPALFALGPDLAGALSIEPGLERGRMSPRAVPLYNLLHRPALPTALAAAALTGLVPTGLLVGALAWGLHIVVDRSLGYGLRTRDGYQRS